jgi:hypothetical protein
VRGGIVIVTAPVSVGTRTGPPSTASSIWSGSRVRRFEPSGVKRSCGASLIVRSTSPGCAPGAPCPSPRRRITCPSSTPFGMTTSTSRPVGSVTRFVASLATSSRVTVRVAATSSPFCVRRPRRVAPSLAVRKASPNICENTSSGLGPDPRDPRRLVKGPAPPNPNAASKSSARGPPAPPWKPPKPWNFGLPSPSISPRSNWARLSASPRIS